MEQRSGATPVAYLRVGERTYWRFVGQWHTDNEALPQRFVHALLVTRAMRRDDHVHRAMTIAARGQLPAAPRRGTIPEDVKQLVWNRDHGAYRACGSKTELRLDHQVPVSTGRATTPENLQTLCGPCNRRKGAGIA